MLILVINIFFSHLYPPLSYLIKDRYYDIVFFLLRNMYYDSLNPPFILLELRSLK